MPLLLPPERETRPERLVILLRGLPGSGKSRAAQLLRETEAKHASGGGLAKAARVVSIDEYFMWTLTFLKTSCGSGLEDVFRRYSSSADGSWSVLELAAAAEDIGFGSVADELFVELDSTNSGAIQHLEVLRHIQSGGISRVGAS